MTNQPPRNEIAERLRAQLRARGLPIVHCEGEDCPRIETLRLDPQHPNELDAPPGWYVGRQEAPPPGAPRVPAKLLLILCPTCRERRGV